MKSIYRKKLLYLICLAALSVAGRGYAASSGYNPGAGIAEGYSEAGTRAAEFLTLPVGGRGVGMGGAFAAVADDISSAWWNPAGLGFIGSTQAFLTVTDLPLDVRYTYAAAASPLLDNRLVLGCFMGMLTSGEQEVTTVAQPEGTGATFSTYSLQSGASMAWNFSDRFSAGFNLKLVHEDIAGNTQSTMAFDMGTNYHATLGGREIRLAFLIRNLGGNMAFSGDDLKVDLPAEDIYPGENIARQEREAFRRATSFKLPTSFHVSLSYNLLTNEYYNWLGAVEFSQNNNMPISYQAGSELVRKLGENCSAALRGGWEFRSDELDLEGVDRLRGLSAGGGISYDFMAFKGTIDYAYRNWGRLNFSQLLSLSLSF
jgi:hypothetical protein